MNRTIAQIADKALERFEQYQDGAFGKYGLDSHQMRLFANEVIMADRAERRIILRSEDGPTPWRVWVQTPYQTYEQVRDLLSDGVDPSRIVWEK